MERQTAGEPLVDAESEKDPAFKPYWKLPDKVLISDTQTLLQDQCLSTYSDISGGFCSLGWTCVASALLWSVPQTDQSKWPQKCPHGCSHIYKSQHRCTSDFANPPQQLLCLPQLCTLGNGWEKPTEQCLLKWLLRVPFCQIPHLLCQDVLSMPFIFPMKDHKLPKPQHICHLSAIRKELMRRWLSGMITRTLQTQESMFCINC